MAEETSDLSTLEDELTCSICLCPFDFPVTIPCGHNFCQDCLIATWKDSFNCPQCRTHFPTKPDLRKNTVLSNLADAFKGKLKSNLPDYDDDVKKKELGVKVKAILCDSCRECVAAKTCLTCMAAFCAEHLRPHLENPVFAAHQLSEPLGDLFERICPEHNKMMEFYCMEHGRCICSFCLQQVHKGCKFSTPDEQRQMQEFEFRNKLDLLDKKIDKNQSVIQQMRDQQSTLRNSMAGRKRMLEGEYRQMRELLDKDEREAMIALDRELEAAQTKLSTLMKKFTQNIEKLSGAKETIDGLLSQKQSLDFLEATVDLPTVVTFDPYTPKIHLETKSALAWTASTAVLKEHLGLIMKQPVDVRLQLLKPGANASPALQNPLSGLITHEPPGAARKPPRCNSPGAGLIAGPKKKTNKNPEQKGDKQNKKPPNSSNTPFSENIPHMARERQGREGFPGVTAPPIDITSPAKRSDLLQYGSVLTFDPKTAHKRIALSDNFTKATVSDEPSAYPDSPARFSVCSQVLCSKGFARGRHYWEVKMSSNNFCGVGLAYNSIDRKGPASRLGRNAQSWCLEWFKVKLSAWHANGETVLVNPNPSRVGVLLDCEAGAATLFNVADRAYPMHTFVFPFAEAVHPAFWIFSSGSNVSLCKLNA